MNGILVIDKPPGMTSHDAVAICRRRLGVRRVGHAGTLDPDATGVLVLGVGRATRLLSFLEGFDKTYRATIAFGVETTTQDAAGEVVRRADCSNLTEADVLGALDAFRGPIMQVPPMVSAVKVGGEALYKKARRGEEVARAPRPVRIHELSLESFDPPTLFVRCSKGTYVRTLVHDLGRALGVGAHVVTLRRLAVGLFRVQDATALDAASPAALRPMEAAVASFSRREVTPEEARALVRGRTIPAAGRDGPYAVFAPWGLVAMAADVGPVARSMCVLVDASRPDEVNG